MLTTVARETKQDVFTLVREPLWRVLYVFHHLREDDERRALQRRIERVDLGVMVAYGFNEPSKLSDEMRSAIDAAQAFERGPVTEVDVEALAARANALSARIASGRALSPEAHVQ